MNNMYRPAMQADLPIMSHVVDIINDREFCTQPILPNAAALREWYDEAIGPAIDKIEQNIRDFPEDYGLLDEDFVDPDKVVYPNNKREN